MPVSLGFYGAARYVTGSKHLLTVGDHRILLDCGMVQGPRRIADRLNRDLPFDAVTIDAVVLSHAHIDHSGSLPRLVKLGFKGAIHCTPATADLAAVLMEDSARLQAQDATHLGKRGLPYEPPYDPEDVRKTCQRFQRHAYHEPFEVVPGVTVEFFDAGHILGSAMVVVDCKIKGQHVRVGFTGDHGRKGMPILRDPEQLPDVDYLITESTYGDRLHDETGLTLDAIARAIDEEMADGGRILVPAFSVGRTQNILWALSQLVADGRIPRQPIWVDSPLSTKATKIVAGHEELFDSETKRLLANGHDPFFFDGVRFVADAEESKALNDVRQGIIISASGMCEGGRILHHLDRSLGRPEDCVAIVGFQAEGTLGRKLVDGHEWVKVFGERRRVRCKIRMFHGLSAHADWKEMLENLQHLRSSVRRVFVVHGEESPAQQFADRLSEAGFRAVEVPVRKEVFTL
jgi:metallo-beta-lactamase family protein